MSGQDEETGYDDGRATKIQWVYGLGYIVAILAILLVLPAFDSTFPWYVRIGAGWFAIILFIGSGAVHGKADMMLEDEKARIVDHAMNRLSGRKREK